MAEKSEDQFSGIPFDFHELFFPMNSHTVDETSNGLSFYTWEIARTGRTYC